MNDTTLQQNYPVMKQTYAEEGRETKDLPEDKTPYWSSIRPPCWYNIHQWHHLYHS